MNTINIKKKFLILFFGFLIVFLLPNYSALAAFTFTEHDTGGKILSFANPVLIAGTGAANGDGAASKGAKYKYTNVITVDGIQVDAIVSVDDIVNATLNTFDDATPNPTPEKAYRIHSKTGSGKTIHYNDYLTSFNEIVPEGAIFAPQITVLPDIKDASKPNPGYVAFTISFQDTSGKPIVLKNVYNNTLDAESTEYNEYGGFVSYQFAGDYKTNTTQHMIATPGLSGNIRFSNSNCAGNNGLYITDSSRVQTKFNTISSLKIVNGQFGAGAVPNGNGGVVTCDNKSIRYYGQVFVKDDFTDTPTPPQVEFKAPTVNFLTTSNTTPSVTGTIGGQVSTASPNGSAMATGDTFSVVLNGKTYTHPNANLVINGTSWTLNVPNSDVLTPGTTYDVAATRNGLLVDQTTNELVITPVCTAPQILNLAGTTCVTPSPTDTILCHSGDGISYAKLIWNSTDTVHITHPYDKEAVNGKCPDEPVVCTLPQILDVPTNTCVTPVVTCVAPQVLDTATNTCKTPAAPNPACTAITYPLPSPMPEGAEYDDKKVTICHFPPGNPDNVHTISISLNALMTHVNRHGDTFWQAGKNCPRTPDDCPPPPPPTPTYPTVDFQTTRDTTPTLTGTIGTTPIAGAGTFSVKVNNTTYSCTYTSPGNSGKLNVNCGSLNIVGTDWTLNTTTAIPIGTYDVLATRAEKQGNGNNAVTVTTTDQTTNELTIISSGCPTGQGFINNVCVPLPVVTVNSQTTTDTTPIITGTVGNVSLDTNEKFYVVVNGKEYSNGDGNLTVTGLNWSLQIPNANAIPAGLYDVAGTRDNGLADITTDELRIDPICTLTQVLVNHVCIDAPTVVSQTTFDTTPTITGTVGITPLGSTEAFSVTVNGTIYAKGNINLTINGLNWTLNIPSTLAVNTYNVDALRAGLVPDPTSGELVILSLISPTVDNKTTTDKVAVPLTGNVGSSTSLQIQVKDSSNTIQDSGTATIIGSTWSFLPKVLPAGTYDVAAIGDAAHGNLKDSTLGELVVTPTVTVIPTVNNVTTTDKIAPTLTGTVGTSTSLTITVQSSPVVSGIATINGTTWTFTPSSPIAAGNYDVVATGETGLTDSTTNELTVTASTIPTVDNKTTSDKIPPTLTGNVGSSKSLTITVKSTPQVSGAATISGTTWSFTSPSKIAAGNYDVEALGETGLKDETSNELTVTTCTLPKIYNAAGDACIVPVPTVIPLTTDSNTPVLTGTVGEVELGVAETFSVAVNGKTYNADLKVANNDLTFKDRFLAFLQEQIIKSANAVTTNPLVVNKLNWTLTIPSTDSIPAGIYDVDAIRNTTSKDVTSKELTINLTCTAPQIFNSTKTACISPIIPTVNNATTTDKIAPTLTGNVGSSSSLTITVQDSTGTKATGAATITDGTWTFTPSSPIAKGIYDVAAVGETGLQDVTKDELTVTMECTLPKVANAAGTACITPIPTVVSLNTPDTTPTLTGTVGTTPLATSETFSVTVDGQTFNRSNNNLTISGTDWTLAIPIEIKPGTYDVDAIRQGTPDETSGELVITDNIDVCERSTSTSKSILRSTFDATKYDLGKCNAPPCALDANGNMIETEDCTPPLPDGDEASLPPLPTSLTDEAVGVNPNEIQYCSDGSVLSGGEGESTDVSIKRARIANATVEGGTFETNTLNYDPATFTGTKMTYGKKVSIPEIILTNYEFNGQTISPVIKKGQATGVKIVGATIENAYVDLLKDYIHPTTGEVISSSDGIKMKGGTTLVKTVNENGKEVYGAITSGMIVSGTDSQGNPMRGRITSGKYTTPLDNTDEVFIKGRRTKGTLRNATIVNARITTVKGVTVVDIIDRTPENTSEGIIISGEMDPSVKASTFGTVVNQTITGKVVTNSNTCFSSGRVSSRGQLNWKEVVK